MIKVSLSSYRPEVIPFLESIDAIEFEFDRHIYRLDKVVSEVVDCIACGESGKGFMFSNNVNYRLVICPKCGYVQGLIIGG